MFHFLFSKLNVLPLLSLDPRSVFGRFPVSDFRKTSFNSPIVYGYSKGVLDKMLYL